MTILHVSPPLGFRRSAANRPDQRNARRPHLDQDLRCRPAVWSMNQPPCGEVSRVTQFSPVVVIEESGDRRGARVRIPLSRAPRLLLSQLEESSESRRRGSDHFNGPPAMCQRPHGRVLSERFPHSPPSGFPISVDQYDLHPLRIFPARIDERRLIATDGRCSRLFLSIQHQTVKRGRANCISATPL